MVRSYNNHTLGSQKPYAMMASVNKSQRQSILFSNKSKKPKTFWEKKIIKPFETLNHSPLRPI